MPITGISPEDRETSQETIIVLPSENGKEHLYNIIKCFEFLWKMQFLMGADILTDLYPDA